ncbi:MAG: hypothetical protein IJ572_00630 [Bacilli bacterium]|nr:hypothetical protein [Bacilli bacterium]
MELVLLLLIAGFCIAYRSNQAANVAGTAKYISNQAKEIYDKVAPFSYKQMRAKIKELGEDYSPKEYLTQIGLIAGFASVVSYLYFYNPLITLIYAGLASFAVPYLAFLRSKRVYSEYVFEQIQTYTTNVIMEFNTTQSFVKSLEGVRDSGILEDPVLSDVKTMIDMSYTNGTIDQSIAYFDERYPYYMVKNMHQLFYQITKEGARDSGESLENMSLDIDALVEGVYRDRMDRQNFHTRFLTFGIALFFLVMAMQFLLGKDSYIKLLDMWYVDILLHGIILINCYFLLSGEKYYNENVGVE